MVGHRLGVLLLAAGLALAACTGGGPGGLTAATNSPGVETASLFDLPDPTPSAATDPIAIAEGGGSIEADGVEVTVPAEAVDPGGQLTVSFGESPGTYAGQIWGHPVQVEHDAPLAAPIEIRWDTTGLTEQQRHTALLVRWDPEREVWVPSEEAPRWEGDVLTARLAEFSFWNWVASFGQEVGELSGTRIDPPRCTGEPLPSWVRDVVDPDEGTEAAAIGTCFEPDRDEIVTVRVTNNRTFTQQMRMVEGGQPWAWTWPGEQTVGVAQVAYDTARFVFDSDQQFLLPPLREVAVGVARPGGGGQRVIKAEATVGPEAVLVDIMTYLLGQLPIGGLDSEVANAAVQALYKCGGEQLLDGGFRNADGLVRDAVSAVTGCAESITDDTAELSRFTPAQVKGSRVVQHLSRAAVALKVGELAYYGSDQLANALVGPLSWSVRGDGRAEPLGQWTPTCADRAEDSKRLYRNIALQDEFLDTSRELHEFPGWADAASQAVKPLAQCDSSYRQQLADELPAGWGDNQAATIVAAALLQLGGDGDGWPEVLLSAPVPSACEHPAGRLVNGELPGIPANRGLVQLDGVGTVEGVVTEPTTMAGEAGVLAVLNCSQGGVSWPQVLVLYASGPTVLGHLDMAGIGTVAEHADISTLEARGDAVVVTWKTYEGCCFDVMTWSGLLRYREGRLAMEDVVQVAGPENPRP